MVRTQCKVETMTEQNRIREREHWQAIAEQLGLSAEPESSGAESSPAEEPRPAQEHLPTPAVPKVNPPLEATEADVAEEETVFLRADFEPVAAAEKERVPVVPSVELDATVMEAAPAEELEADPERPSRRRRRGRGEQNMKVGGGEHRAEAAPAPAEEALDQEPQEQPSRRGRGRGQPARIKAAPPAIETKKEIPSQESAEETEDMDDFSKWNVPSWNELIASLYRPQR